MGEGSINKPLLCIKRHCDNDTVQGQHCNDRDNEKVYASGLFSYLVEATLTS
jgi:hypothetical protein